MVVCLELICCVAGCLLFACDWFVDLVCSFGVCGVGVLVLWLFVWWCGLFVFVCSCGLGSFGRCVYVLVELCLVLDCRDWLWLLVVLVFGLWVLIAVLLVVCYFVVCLRVCWICCYGVWC